MDDRSWWESFQTYLEFRYEDVLELAIDHVWIVLVSVALATLVGVGLGITVYRTQRARELVLAVTGTILTIPSLALFGLFVTLSGIGLGLGARSVILGLMLYGLLPIVRNTIVGLQSVDAAIVESAQGMGMGRSQRLLRVELPLAWPVILTGMRVSTLLIIGIAAIGAYINGPGLGELIFTGLARIGGANALNEVLAGTLGIVVLAIVFDLFFAVFAWITVPRGIR